MVMGLPPLRHILIRDMATDNGGSETASASLDASVAEGRTASMDVTGETNGVKMASSKDTLKRKAQTP